jgi:hypothetical protein
MTTNLFDAENDSAAQDASIEAKSSVVGGATRVARDRDTVLLAAADGRFLPMLLVRGEVAVPKRILLTSTSIWRMADRRGGAGIWPVWVLYLVLLEMRISACSGSLETRLEPEVFVP